MHAIQLPKWNTGWQNSLPFLRDRVSGDSQAQTPVKGNFDIHLGVSAYTLRFFASLLLLQRVSLSIDPIIPKATLVSVRWRSLSHLTTLNLSMVKSGAPTVSRLVVLLYPQTLTQVLIAMTVTSRGILCRCRRFGSIHPTVFSCVRARHS